MDTVIYSEPKRKRLVQSILKLYRKKKLELDHLLHDIMIIEIGEGTPPPAYKKALYHHQDDINSLKTHAIRYMMNMNERLLLALYGYKQFEQYKTFTRRAY